MNADFSHSVFALLRRLFPVSLLALALPLNAPAIQQPEDPAADFAPVANLYLKALSEGRFEDALALIDFRGMSDYLIDRRMTEIRQGNPDMTPEEEAKMIAGFREKEVSQERIRQVALDLIHEQDPQGMTWTFKQTAKSKNIPNGIILTYEMIQPGKPPKNIPLGLQKVGPKWYIAPHLMEKMLLPIKAEPIKPPESAILFGNRFWEHWRVGEMDLAYESFDGAMRVKVPLLNFLESTRKIIEEFGILMGWTLFDSYKLPEDQISMVYDLQFGKKKGRSILVIKEKDSAWQITGFQFLKGADQTSAPVMVPTRQPPIVPAAPREPVQPR